MNTSPELLALQESSHRRWNPLLKEWVLVSPHRSKRPWQGAVEKKSEGSLPAYLPDCYLCPGNLRSNGECNPNYEGVFVFKNDFSALSDAAPVSAVVQEAQGIIQASQEHGICRVICFSPRHDLTIPDLSVDEISGVIDGWRSQYEELGSRPEIAHVMTFENKGAVMGCSNPHPHGQIWASSYIPNLAAKSADSQENYFNAYQQPLLISYLAWELQRPERIITSNEHWVALVPFWAVWPFEVMILPKRPVGSISELTTAERKAWAAIIREMTRKYDNLFKCSFPYSMGVYQKPTDGKTWNGFVMHQIFLPPLLRSATVKKFMVGFELCGEPQRDITAEDAAARLRQCSNTRAPRS